MVNFKVMPKEKLIIFVKNEEAGKTKTRLAAVIGDEEALKVYQRLLKWTFEQTRDIDVVKEVCYSQFIPKNDVWSQADFKKEIQSGTDLGKRMSNSFKRSFEKEGFDKVVIIGSDCAELTSEVIKKAFKELNSNELVIGPAEDGGYYLLGMRSYYPQVFEEISWSTNSVLDETIKNIEELKASFSKLKTMNDVDTIEDWNKVRPGL